MLFVFASEIKQSQNKWIHQANNQNNCLTNTCPNINTNIVAYTSSHY
jgi:hypothetical protein